MRRAMTPIFVLALFMALTLPAQQNTQQPKQEEGIQCKLTGKKVKECCCEVREGKTIYCTLAKKTTEKCCCEPVQAPKPKKG